jgi:hypothetical protein
MAVGVLPLGWRWSLVKLLISEPERAEDGVVIARAEEFAWALILP